MYIKNMREWLLHVFLTPLKTAAQLSNLNSLLDFSKNDKSDRLLGRKKIRILPKSSTKIS
jgi:hypothetical protein